MASTLNLPQAFKIVTAILPLTSNTGKTSDYISMKHAHKVWIVVHATQDTGHATTFTPSVATGVLPAGATPATYASKWWLNTDVSLTDTLVRQTDAVAITLDAGATDQLAVIEIDPAEQIATHGATFDCLGVICSNSAQAANFVSVVFYVEERYPQATPPTAITD